MTVTPDRSELSGRIPSGLLVPASSPITPSGPGPDDPDPSGSEGLDRQPQNCPKRLDLVTEPEWREPVSSDLPDRDASADAT